MKNLLIKRSYRCIGILTILFSFYSCDKSNININNVTKEQLLTDNLLTGSFIVQMQQNAITTNVNAYQLTDNLIGDIYSGYMSASGNWFSSRNNTTYSLISDWNNEAFSRAFTSVMPAWKSVLENAISGDLSVPAVANIIKVFALHRTTDIYGPLPYTRFLEEGTSKAYDSQADIYKRFFEELDESILNLTNFVALFPNEKPLAKFDLVYAGDYVKWIKFANTLKLRLAMRIVYVDPTLAQQHAESAVNHQYGVIQTNEEMAQLKSNSQIIINNPLRYIWNDYADIRMSASMYSYMVGYKDPRISKYFNFATRAGSNNSYLGIREGSNITDKGLYTTFSTPNIQLNTPILWISAAESYFLRAEGAIRNWNMGDNAESLYNKGITISFEQHGAPLGAYLTDAVSKPVNYIDPVNSSNNISASINNVTIQWSNAANFETKLERIITQKWIAMFPNGQEGWSEFRRTKYPRIFPVANNFSGGIINTATQIRRIPFPNIEYQTNAQAVNAAISLLGGADNGATKLWWDKKP